ncbi:hypothetical protein RCO48_37020 [Peribacillus frigoritolerans]|nr:hypothetical protein [Peribacillus frigoritolerans]
MKMIEEKVLDNVDFLYGVHLRPVEEVKDGQAAPAIVHGAAQFIKGEIAGTDAHGARPHQGQNAIEIGAAFITLLNGIHLNPSIPYSVKMTQFFCWRRKFQYHPGGEPLFSLDLRAQDNAVMKELTKKVEKVAESLAIVHGVEVKLKPGTCVAAATVNDQAQEIMSEAIADTLGEENLVAPVITTGGEDFHFYTLKRPELESDDAWIGL